MTLIWSSAPSDRHLYRSLEKFYTKQNLFYWQRPWALSAQNTYPEWSVSFSPNQPMRPRASAWRAPPCTLTHT